MASPATTGTAADSATGAANTTSLTVTMPGSIAAGEGIFVVVSWDGTGTLTVNAGSSSAGWAKLGQETNSTLCTQACFWQPNAIGGGSDALVISSSASERGTAIAIRVTGQDTSITPDWLGQSGAAAADAANGPNVNGTGGSKDYLAFTTCTLDTAATVPTAAPSTYGGLETHAGAASSVTSAFATKQFTGASEDPGVFTHASQAWVAATILVHPPTAAAADIPSLVMPPIRVIRA